MTDHITHLSLPEVSDRDRAALVAAFDGGWIAPLGPEVDAFEEALAAVTHRRHVSALSTGTAALHLALVVADVQPGDVVIVSSLTFAASANVIRYVGAEPMFVDSERSSWNMDPDLLAELLEDLGNRGRRVGAVIAVDLYGQIADYTRLAAVCDEHGIVLIEDAAEALGASRDGHPAGSFGDMAILSFNGNKIITTSGGGALLSDRSEWNERAVFLATQARDPAPHYEHSNIGYNYRLSNLLAALGRSQLADLERRVEIRRGHFDAYREGLAGIDGVEFMPEADGSFSNRWLTTLTFDERQTGVDREKVRLTLASQSIESRPVWKPMHLQPVFRDCRVAGGDVSEDLFNRGLCLPSSSSLTREERDRVIGSVISAHAD